MRKEDLSDAIGSIDEDIINETGQVRQQRPARSGANPVVIGIVSGIAALAAAAAGIIFIPKALGGNGVPVADQTTAADTLPAIITTTAPLPKTTEPSTASALDSEPDMLSLMSERKLTTSSTVKNIRAESTVGESISVSSDLMIELYSETSEDDLRSMMTVTPDVPFTLTRESATSYRLTVENNFRKGSLVKVEITGEDGGISGSWAFKTIDDFKVNSRFPSDGVTGVSLDSGIEVEFTFEPSSEDLSEYVVIDPPIDVNIYTQKRTLYIIPEKSMTVNTGYTVTLKKGLPSAQGETLEEDDTFSFRTTEYSGNFFFAATSSYNGFAESFVPGDTVCVEIMCSPSLQTVDYDTKLYRFPNTEAYYDAIKAKTQARWADDADTDTSGLDEVFSSYENPYVRESPGDFFYSRSSAYAMLPDDLEEGCYIAEVTAKTDGTEASGAGNPSLQYLIEVTPVSVYMINVGSDVLLYVNDAVSGKPAVGASVTIETKGKTLTAEVGSDGLVKLDSSGISGGALLDIKFGSHRYTDRIDILQKTSDGYYDMNYGQSEFSDLYYTYLYTDREAYLPTDTVNVWGYIIPKARVTAMPEDISLTFFDTVTNEVQPDANGFFSASYTFSDLYIDYGGNIRLLTGDNVLTQKYVRVREYTKPTYVVDIETPDYVVLPQKDPFDVTVSASYYEGTPAEGVVLKNDQNSQRYTTGEDGTFTASIRTDSEYSHPWTLSGIRVAFSVAGIENTYEGAWADVPAFLSDVMFIYDYDEDSKSLTVHANKMDFSNVDAWFREHYKGNVYSISRDSYEMLKGEALSIPVSVSVTRRWYEKHETGSYYDAIEKRTVRSYEYNSMEEEMGTFRLDTVNGECVFRDLPIEDDEDSWYNISIEYSDLLGQSFYEVIIAGRGDPGWIGTYISNFELGSFGFDSSSGNLLYLLSANGEEHKESLSDWGYASALRFHEDEEITVSLECANDGGTVNGMFLLAVYNDEAILSYKLYDAHGTTDFRFTADRSFIPTVRYTGAYFDGRHIYKCYGGAMTFDPERRRIDLGMKTDAEKYDAGDTASITIKATDVKGEPVSGATVQLSLVDEAAFAVADQQVDILNDMYPYKWIGNANEYLSYIQHLSESKSYGEKGGGDGELEVRKDFRDTAFFESAVTGADGSCTFTVKFPDNITTWRATVQAVYMTPEERLLAGNIRQPVVVTRPVFITPIMQSTFVAGDDIAVSAKAAGITRNDTITVNITGNGYNAEKTILQQQTANFGKLPAGEYKVLFTAEKDGFRDAAELPLTVAETLLETDIERVLTLSGLKDIAPTKYPVDIAFFDKEYILNTNILYKLLSYHGDRNDMRLAAAYAWSVLYPDYSEPIDETSSGLAKALPASEPSFEVTALMCAAAPDAVSSTAIVNKFRSIMEGEMTILDRSCSYMGLAALGEPVMNEVKAFLSSGVNIDTQSGIYLSAALAFCGDRQAAYDTYIKYVPNIAIDDTDPDAIKAGIITDGSADQALTRTALITASLLDLPEAEGFARSLYSSEPDLDSYSLQLVVYLDHYIPKTKGNASFTYNDNGEQKTVLLDRHHPTHLRFTKEQFADAGFTLTNGDITAVTRYIGRVDQNDTDPTMTVTKTYSGTFAPGETITVELHSAKYSVIYDVIPSCGKYDGYRDPGRLIKLYTDQNGNASYTFTINISGEYITECPVVRNFSTGEWGIGESGTIKVTGDESA